MVLSLSTEGEKKRAEEEEEESSEVRAKLVAQNEIGKGATAFHGTRSGSLLEIVDGPLSNEVTEKEKEFNHSKRAAAMLILIFLFLSVSPLGACSPPCEVPGSYYQ